MISEGMNFDEAMLTYAAACCATINALSSELDEELIYNDIIPDPERQQVLSEYPQNFVDILQEQGKSHLAPAFIHKLNLMAVEINNSNELD